MLLAQKQPTAAPEYKGPVHCEITVKGTTVTDEFELYDLTRGSMELSNRIGVTSISDWSGISRSPRVHQCTDCWILETPCHE